MEGSAEIRRKLTAERGFRAVASFEELGAGERFGAESLLLYRCGEPIGIFAYTSAAGLLPPLAFSFS